MPSALNPRHRAPVAVARHRPDSCLHTETQIRKRPLAALSKWLPFLWSVNFSEPDYYLLVGSRLTAAGLERVAVSDSYHEAQGQRRNQATTRSGWALGVNFTPASFNIHSSILSCQTRNRSTGRRT
jgi:hypothetical protein